MGNFFGTLADDELSSRDSTLIEDIEEFAENRTYNNRRRRKRLIERLIFEEKDSDVNNDHESKKFKLDTPKYVYEKLFLEGHESDVVITALGHKWNLHRVYLKQCDYFKALFGGKWKDSDQKEYSLDIADENICYLGFYY